MFNFVRKLIYRVLPYSDPHRDLIMAIANAHSIPQEYLDFRGDDVKIPFRNIVRVLQALNYDVHEKFSLQDQLNDNVRCRWLNLLEPVTVLTSMREWVLYLYLNADDAGLYGKWRFDSELGSHDCEGCFKVGELKQSDECWVGGEKYIRLGLPLPEDLPLGYHRITVKVGEREGSSPLIVTPSTSYQPEELDAGRKIWGSSIQLYSLRSSRNWGIGDFTDLMQLIKDMAELGADIIGLNPIHALSSIAPQRPSPYSPSNRGFINPLYIDVERVPEFESEDTLRAKFSTDEFKMELEELRTADEVNYVSLSSLKHGAFSELYECFRRKHLGKGTEREQAFKNFVKKNGESLREFALFEAMLTYFNKIEGWPSWPKAYQNPLSYEVKQFELHNEKSINYYIYLQFLADEQLQEAYKLAKELGMTVGICRDLAVGTEYHGSEVWANQKSFCLKASIGVPPDELGLDGQNWGSPPLDPIKLKQDGYQATIKLFRSNMRACGALRIDHAMSLLRLWWCPPFKYAKHGTYVYYDMLDMIGILNLESQRNSCMIIAEDIGTVPPEVTEFFPKANLYSNKVFFFEVGEQGCTLKEDYPSKSLAVMSNHDLPTLKAYWDKSDLALRLKYGQLKSKQDYQNECKIRASNKNYIIEALKNNFLLPEGFLDSSDHTMDMDLALCFVLHKYLATSNSQVIMIQLEDLMLMSKPVNIPGVRYPSWRRKLAESNSELFSRPEIIQFCKEVNLLRKFS